MKHNSYCYRFRDDSGEILYIGCTDNPKRRMKEHKYGWVFHVNITVDLMQVPFNESFEIEDALIRRYKPWGNRKVNRYANQYEDITETWTPWLKLEPDYWKPFYEVKNETIKSP